MAKFTPIFDRVLIERDITTITEEKTAAGLIVPEMQGIDHRTGKPIMADKIELNTGTIISIGDGVEHPLLVPGAKVYFGKHAGAYIHPNRTERKRQMAEGLKPTVDDEKYFVCADADIIGVFEEEEQPHE